MPDKQVLWMLEKLEGFEKPKIQFEQYATSAELAVSMMEMIDSEVGIDDCLIADLGCGCGMLMTTIATCYEPQQIIGIDIDEDALEICSRNIESTEIEEKCEIIRGNALEIRNIFKQPIFDIVVLNPPFGTKNNSGIDMKFVENAISICRPGGSVFSLHKSSTRDFILKTARKWEDLEKVETIAEMRWNLPATYRFHKQKAVDIQVDLVHFLKKSL
ncbi:unnamed protein product [Caenorhabditis angaria]|uniref:Methyltransferase-like protein 5 n=1 Tax=Caenorhabditis angaria TaxID=860376 RepID=A0A9P1N1Y0_9PELO|nr:unnamed protein product [Caenorhabditis angaria]